MYPKSSRLIQQQGFSMLTVLFILVLLGVLAVAMVRLNQSSNVSVAQEVLSIRAFFAAESGAQSAASEIFPISGAGSCSNRTINFTTAGLTGCRAQLTCSSFTVDSEVYYRITSVGSCAIGTEYEASRTLQTLLKEI
ncbi:hypothetical protein [Pleionea sp. CnH1-48]|uniref:hypothetical protein n=1 Tax=Pleionea sp. CnH1-48 TaxID=2954494 RepID=UPI002096EEB0|nr:hypothetical protein [Pleionea sp. CnH1-48]MCO7226302.1 hypothetical protein [Pleionea sp. CnH1-48]